MKAPIPIGLIGCGNIGTTLANAIPESGLGVLAAVYDVDAGRATALATRFAIDTCRSEAELLARADVRAVLIATPTSLHADSAIRAAEAGKAIFLEKPMCLTSADCQRVLAAVTQHDVPLMVGQALRYFEPFRSILQWASAGTLGRPLQAHIWRMEKDFLNIADWKRRRAMAGGFLYEVSCHEVDFLRLLMGEPIQVETELDKAPGSAHEIEDAVHVTMRFAAGATAQYQGGAGFPRTEYGFRLRFEKATLESDEAFDPQALRITPTPGSAVTLPPLGGEDPFHAEIRAWLECLSQGEPMPVTGEDAARTIALIEKIYRSGSATDSSRRQN